jgi:hypothetical protein
VGSARGDTTRIVTLTAFMSPGGSAIRPRGSTMHPNNDEPPVLSKEDPMLGPNQHTFNLANQSYEERLSHSARIQQIQRDRGDHAEFDRTPHRAITVRRLAAAGIAGVVLTAALAAGGVGSVAAAPNHAMGGGAALIR